MPEGPEVKKTTDFLKGYIGKYLAGVTLKSGRYLKKKEIPGWILNQKPAKLTNVNCKGKFIYFTLVNNDSKIYVLHSLMMTGRWQNNYEHINSVSNICKARKVCIMYF